MDDIINIFSVTPLRPNNVQDIPLSSHFSLVDCLLIDIYKLNLLNTIDRYFYKKKKSQTLTFIYMYQHKSVEPHGHSS